MIHNDIIIQLKGSSKEERAQVKAILVNNYMKLLDSIEKEADYCTVDAYWTNFTPTSKPIIKAKDFINKHFETI